MLSLVCFGRRDFLRQPLFQAQRKAAFLNVNAVTLGLFGQLDDQIQERVAVGGIAARRAGGVHAFDILSAGEETQQDFFVGNALAAVFSPQIFQRIGGVG